MLPELKEYRRQFQAIEVEARLLLSGLTESQMVWREKLFTWSIGDCLDHLVVAGEHSLRNIHAAAADARARGMVSRGPFRHGVVGTLFVRVMDAPARFRFRAPKAYRPACTLPAAEICARFFQLQTDLIGALEAVDGIDLVRVKVENPVTNWFNMSLGQEFALTAAHERRHLWQASRVRQKLEAEAREGTKGTT